MDRLTETLRGIRDGAQRVVDDITGLTQQTQHQEINIDTLSMKIRHIEYLYNSATQINDLLEQKPGGAATGGDDEEGDDEDGDDEDGDDEDGDDDGGDNDGDRDDMKVPRLGDIVLGIKTMIYGQEVTDMLLDINTAGQYVSLSGDGKTVITLDTHQHYPSSPGRFQFCQVLTTGSFPSGRHHWDVEGSEIEEWRIGVSYPSIERGGVQSYIGNNNKSWCLYRHHNNPYKVLHDSNDINLPHVPSCNRIRISLDYEAGRLSFYELSDPIRHLHTFTATFTEPLHGAFGVWDWITVIS